MKTLIIKKETKYNRIKKLFKNKIKIIVAGILIVAAVNLLANLFDREVITEKSAYPDELNGIKVYTDILPKGIPGRPAKKREIKYIIIHETDNERSSADAKAHNHYLHNIAKTKKLSWHYTVDDSRIYHHLPDNEISFNAGDGQAKNGGNVNGIGIEMCVNKGGDYEKTLGNTSSLVAFLINEYELSINDVKKHQDFSGKTCPARLINDARWDEFLSMIKDEL